MFNDKAMQHKWGWPDVYKKNKYQKFPDWLIDAKNKCNELDALYKSLTDVEPIPYNELADIREELEVAEKKWDELLQLYCAVPIMCDCGGAIVAFGNDMKCAKCGRDYTPDYDPIPF